jgi:hypothetical protein
MQQALWRGRNMDLAPDEQINLINEVIHDSAGKPYRLCIIEYADGEVRAWLLDRRIWAGQFNCLPKTADALELCQITIHDDAPYRELFLKPLIRYIRRRPRPKLSYRGRGLGDELLQSVIRYARQKGYLRIVGYIHPFDDGWDSESVARWYRKNGFIVRGRLLLYEIGS